MFIKTRIQPVALLVTIQQEKASACEIKKEHEVIHITQEEAMDIVARLLNKYIPEKGYKSSEKLSQEVEKIEIKLSDTQSWVQHGFG